MKLLQENEDLGKMTSSGQIAKLKGELAMTKKLCQELKKHQGETDEFVQVKIGFFSWIFVDSICSFFKLRLSKFNLIFYQFSTNYFSVVFFLTWIFNPG